MSNDWDNELWEESRSRSRQFFDLKSNFNQTNRIPLPRIPIFFYIKFQTFLLIFFYHLSQNKIEYNIAAIG